MNWKKRGARILASFVIGYGSGISVTVPIFASFKGTGDFDLVGMLTWPLVAGLVASLPQLGMVLSEYSEMK